MTHDKDALLKDYRELLTSLAWAKGKEPHPAKIARITAALEDKVEAERPEPVKTFTCGLCGTAPSVEKSDYDTLLDYADRMRTYWQAIDNRMVVLHLGTADSFDADTCMNKILEWETQIALDPSVSRQAEELRDTHKERAETAERQLAAMEKVITAEDAEIVRDVQRLERQLAELQAKHDALVRAAETTRPLSALDNAEDAERYRHLQNIDPKDAQAFFWNFNSRRQRSAAIDAARKESHD